NVFSPKDCRLPPACRCSATSARISEASVSDFSVSTSCRTSTVPLRVWRQHSTKWFEHDAARTSVIHAAPRFDSSREGVFEVLHLGHGICHFPQCGATTAASYDDA